MDEAAAEGGRTIVWQLAASQARHCRRAIIESLVFFVIATGGDVHAQLAVSSNDNKVRNVEGVNTVVRNPPPDTVTILDLGVSPPKIVGELVAPGSWAIPRARPRCRSSRPMAGVRS